LSCWLVLGALLLSGLASAAWVVGNMSAQPLPKRPGNRDGDAECRLVAQIEAQRQAAITQAQTPLRGVPYVSPLLRGEPAPWRVQADDTIETRLRLWATGFRKAAPRPPLDCGSMFRGAGLSVDPGEAARPEATAQEWIEVASYSRAWASPRRRWMLIRSQRCTPAKRATTFSVSNTTGMLEYLDGRWVTIASDAKPITLALAYLPGPSVCPRTTN
jgi:hypothetical protein